jgi:TatD DNase family protein
MPRERVLTETDGPFQTMQGRPAMPGDVRQTILALADFWRCPEKETRQTVAKNFVVSVKETKTPL